MNFDFIDSIIRIFAASVILLFTGIAFVFWLTGLEHNLNYSSEAIKYWFVGIVVHLLLIFLILVALFPHKIEASFPQKFIPILIRIPPYTAFLVGLFILIRQIFSSNK